MSSEIIELLYAGIQAYMSILVAARSKAGIVGSNPTQRHGYLCNLFCVCVVLCVRSGLATGLYPVQGVLPTILYRIMKLKIGQGPTKGL
jgi:hypothetical protein